MPHPGHFICASDCKFHLNTYVGNYVVSTIGEYLPDAPIREIIAKSRKVKLTGMGDARKSAYMDKIGYEDIGYGRKYETMVFRAVKSKENKCCPYRMAVSSESDFRGYTTPENAYAGHLELCEEWAKKE